MRACCKSMMSVMSVIKVILLKARYKILFDSVCKQVVSITLLSLPVISSIYFFLVKRNFAKKGVILVISVLHRMKVRGDLLHQKNKCDLLH